jgi:hypothetical protein
LVLSERKKGVVGKSEYSLAMLIMVRLSRGKRKRKEREREMMVRCLVSLNNKADCGHAPVLMCVFIAVLFAPAQWPKKKIPLGMHIHGLFPW